MSDDPIPGIVKHMTLRVLSKSGGMIPTKARFRSAYNIAVAQCNKYGYTSGGKATAKGAKHEKEGMRGFVKNRLFEAMFAWIIKTNKGTPIPGPAGEAKPREDNDAHWLGRNKKQ
jgi:hypothetical protein